MNLLDWPPPGGLLETMGMGPAEIEQRSRRLATEAADRWGGGDRELASSCIYAAGDPAAADLLSIAGDPAGCGAAALRAGRGVLVDISMVRAGATRVRAPLAVAVAGAEAAELAARSGTTRAAAGMALAWERFGRGGIVVVGNAPTALLAALDLSDRAGAPACVVATCPGFTLAAEAKEALVASRLPHVALRGTRGGSGIAAAALNAIARLADA